MTACHPSSCSRAPVPPLTVSPPRGCISHVNAQAAPVLFGIGVPFQGHAWEAHKYHSAAAAQPDAVIAYVHDASFERRSALQSVARLLQAPEHFGLSTGTAMQALHGFDLQAAEFNPAALARIAAQGSRQHAGHESQPGHWNCATSSPASAPPSSRMEMHELSHNVFAPALTAAFGGESNHDMRLQDEVRQLKEEMHVLRKGLMQSSGNGGEGYRPSPQADWNSPPPASALERRFSIDSVEDQEDWWVQDHCPNISGPSISAGLPNYGLIKPSNKWHQLQHEKAWGRSETPDVVADSATKEELRALREEIKMLCQAAISSSRGYERGMLAPAVRPPYPAPPAELTPDRPKLDVGWACGQASESNSPPMRTFEDVLAASSHFAWPRGSSQQRGQGSRYIQASGYAQRGVAPDFTTEVAENNLWELHRDVFDGYASIFYNMDRNQDGFVEGAEVRQLFDRSFLDPYDLAHIWSLVDTDREGRLPLERFAVAIHLVSLMRSGMKLPAVLPIQLTSVAIRFAEERRATQLKEEPRRHVQISVESSPWLMLPEELDKYLAAFAMLDVTGGGSISSDDAKEVFERTELPQEELAQIWAITDVDGDNQLSAGEFACAMHLAWRRRQGHPLPPVLPLELVALCQVRCPAIPPQDIQPAAKSLFAQSISPPQSDPAVSSNTTVGSDHGTWPVDSQLLQRYRQVFEATVRRHPGFLSSEEAHQVLQSSRLSDADLRGIWQLSDSDCDGRLSVLEFACAMHLICRRREGIELPKVLPRELASLLAMCTTEAPLEAESNEGGFIWEISAQQLDNYKALFEVLEKRVPGFVQLDEGRAVLERSSLPNEELWHIWRLADASADSKLNLAEFVCAMHLVCCRRQGFALPSELPAVLRAVLEDAAFATPTKSVWHLGDSQLKRYWELFNAVERRSASVLGPDEAKELLERSQLPNSELSFIWQMSDADQDGQLTFLEFACAMHLAVQRRQGAELPAQLPPELVCSLTGFQAPDAWNGTVSIGPPPLPPPVEPPGPEHDPWLVSQAEIAAYCTVFQGLDVQQKGRLGAMHAKEIFERSGLPMEELSHIWRLAVRSEDGALNSREFACAMHLLSRRRQGLPLPSEVPAALSACLA